MSIRLSSEQINTLIHDYLKEMGLNYTAFILEREATIPAESKGSANLVELLSKALILENIDIHKGNADCNSAITLLGHNCSLQGPNSPQISASLIYPEDCTTIRTHSGEITITAFIENNLLVGSSLGELNIWETSSSIRGVSTLPHINIQGEPVSALFFTVSRKKAILTVGSDSLIRQWSTKYRLYNTIIYEEAILQVEYAPKSSKYFILSTTRVLISDNSQEVSIEGKFTAAAWKSDEVLSVGSNHGLFELTGGILEKKMNSPVLQLAWDAQGNFLYFKNEHGSYVWNGNDTWEIPYSLDVAEWNPKSPLLISSAGDRIMIWKVERRQMYRILHTYDRQVQSIRHRTDGVLLAISIDTLVDIWDIERMVQLRRLVTTYLIKCL